MVKVITYGTYDLLHFGHIRLLERAKALGDYLIVAVTTDDFDKTRGKINVQQSLMERIEAVRATGLADEIIVEEYEGQKIDDIRRYGIDIFTVGSDWVGKFDYLNEYCKVVYLERTEGVSSSEIRTQDRKLRLGILGYAPYVPKVIRECGFVNGIEVVGVCVESNAGLSQEMLEVPVRKERVADFLDSVDALYVVSEPEKHFEQIKMALERGKHILCEAPIAVKRAECLALFELAKAKGCILMEGIKTAYSTAYSRLLLMIKSGKIGDVVSVEATCTSLRDLTENNGASGWNSICAWGPVAMLPVFQILGVDYTEKRITSWLQEERMNYDLFTKIDFTYPNAVATVNVGKGVKSEGELIISGTQGYVYVPAPWWKTDYFEVRYENSEYNKRYFYQLDGEGIRYEVVSFLKAIERGKDFGYISSEISVAISTLIENFNQKELVQIKK